MVTLEYQKKSNRIYSEFGCHYHDVYEVYYFVSGDAEILVEGKIYPLKPHSLILLAPNVLHGIQVNSTADYVRYCLYIAPEDIIPERLHILKHFMPDLKKDPNQEILYEHTESFRLEEFFYNIKQVENQPPETQAVLLPIFTEAIVAQLSLLCNTLRPFSHSGENSNKVTEIINYLNVHLSEALTLESIADHFFISKNYLNKTFKQVVGTTVMEYLRLKRVLLARQYIRDGETAMNAAMLVGFSDYSSFYRSYTKYIKSAPRDEIRSCKADL